MTTLTINGNLIDIEDGSYIFTNGNEWDYWFRCGFQVGNGGFYCYVQAGNEADAIELIGDAIESAPTTAHVPRIILTTTAEFNTALDEYVDDGETYDNAYEMVTESIYPVNGGQFWIDMPTIIEKVGDGA